MNIVTPKRVASLNGGTSKLGKEIKGDRNLEKLVIEQILDRLLFGSAA
jgi:hypothetical protein